MFFFAQVLEESRIVFKKRKKVVRLGCLACFLLSLDSLPPSFFYGGWGMREAGAVGGRGGDRHRPTGRGGQRARKNKCESAKCVVAVPVRRSVVHSSIHSFVLSFEESNQDNPVCGAEAGDGRTD